MGMEACIFNIQKFCIHDGPGIRTAVFFKGCPLRCLWCSNPESQETGVQPEREPALSGAVYTLEKVIDICLDDRDFYAESGGGVTLSGGEALMQFGFAGELLRGLKAKGIHTALETTGFAAPEIFRSVISRADLLLYDLKHYDGEKHMKGTGVDNRIILQNLHEAVEQRKDIMVRIPVIPEYNDGLNDAKSFAKLLKKFGLKKAQLLPFHQFGQKKYETLKLPYELEHVQTLHPEDLRDYKLEMENAGISCFL